MSAHYAFNYRFCNARTGWEKGHVEQSVEYVRRKAFSLTCDYATIAAAQAHLATALGIAACHRGHSVLFTSVPRLLTTVREAKSQHRLIQIQNRFEKYDLAICDEFGYVSCDKEDAELLFNHLSLRAETRSTIITTNLAFSRWNEIIPDKVLVNAPVDRLTHKAKIINMTGTSFRLKQTQQMIKNQV